ncbi:TlpA family protein disulfide reductase [Spongiibacter sp. UBA1325]|uniref:TlpA family protein disulfide reductase n=1 Tax=Spongiibacter sp. UBA1325 TaxID=1947543 RepID=UPI00257B203A|nr:TlpA disulfide reductase family protein [Spongiibacter sp. UBA1325]|tara:strand:- start:2136 stop:2612 length:477 start_codon:yes stop_codon:yes gene_type:complete
MNMLRSLSLIIGGQLLLLTASFSLASEASANFSRGNFDLANYEGKVVYLDFWASWCGPCRASFPFMNRLVSEYGDDLAVVTINLDEDADSAKEFIEEFQPTFPVFYDPDGIFAKQYKVAGMPNSFLFDRRGQLLLKHIGFTKRTPDELDSQIKNAIRQ